MSTTIALDELRNAGLIDGPGAPHLTDKGWDWLRILEDARGMQPADSEWAADLVLSVNGLSR